MAAAAPTVAFPGQFVGAASSYRPGPGVHLHEGSLYSSLLGSVSITQPAKPTTAPGPAKRLNRITAPAPSFPPKEASLPTVSVSRRGITSGGEALPPAVGDVVLCKVTRASPRQATVGILVCGDAVLETEWQGVIRVQDVRATEKDRVKIHESFRPGDIVRAEVISLGDQANYYLSTAKNELGVIMATSDAGNAMYPVSWKEYRDPETGLSESRKVAKPN